MNVTAIGAIGINVTLLITLIAYIGFAIFIIDGVLKGAQRGVVKSSVRFALLVGFLIIAGFVTLPITKALMLIDVSFLGVQYEGVIASTPPNVSKALLFSNENIKLAAESNEAIMTLIENLPAIVLSLVVFLLLVMIFRFLSWITFVIIDKTALKSSKLERQAKKQAKIEKKNKKNGVATLQTQQVVLQNKKKYRIAGGVIGLVQGFILAFLTFLPLGAVCGFVGKLTAQPTIQNGVSASQEVAAEDLTEYSSDIIRTYLGDETIGYFDAYNNTFVSKVLSLGGFDQVIFDEITATEIKGEKVVLRKDILQVADIYDSYAEITNFVGGDGSWKSTNFEEIRDAVDSVFNISILKAILPDLTPYLVEKYVYPLELVNNLPENEEFKSNLTSLLKDYKQQGFMESLKIELNSILNIVEKIFASGLFDDMYTKNLDSDMVKAYLSTNDYELLEDASNLIFDSELVKIFATVGVNIGEVKLSSSLGTSLKYVSVDDFSREEKNGFVLVAKEILKNFDDVFALTKTDIENMTKNQIGVASSILTTLKDVSFNTVSNSNTLVRRENISIDKTSKTVTNGGLFSNLYITIVDYLLKDYFSNIAYESANWNQIFNSVKTIIESSSQGEAPTVENIITVLGVDEDLKPVADTVGNALEELTAEEKPSEERIQEITNEVIESIDTYVETGNSVEELIQKVAEATGQSEISKDTIESKIDEYGSEIPDNLKAKLKEFFGITGA